MHFWTKQDNPHPRDPASRSSRHLADLGELVTWFSKSLIKVDFSKVLASATHVQPVADQNGLINPGKHPKKNQTVAAGGDTFGRPENNVKDGVDYNIPSKKAGIAMSSFSIIVPKLGPSAEFENTLASILRYRLPKHQVIVVHSDQQPDTYGLSGEVEFVESTGQPNLVRFFNLGVEAAQGAVMNFIRPGVEVTHQWFVGAIRALAQWPYCAVTARLADSRDRSKIVSTGISIDHRMCPRHCKDVTALGPSSWAAFYRRDVIKLIGAIDETLDEGFLDLDLALSITSLGLKSRTSTDGVLTIQSAGRLNIRSSEKTGFSAQRMIQRHIPTKNQPAHSILAAAGECIHSIWRPSRFVQMLGRPAARSKRATDIAFARQLALARHELLELRQKTEQKLDSSPKRAA